MEDRLAIRELMEAYADAVFRHDAEGWAACWTEDAVWALPTVEISPLAKMAPAWKQAMAGFPFAGFFVFPGEIVVEGDQARARSYTQEHLILTDGQVRRIIGRYDDELRKADGRWRFAIRRYSVLNEA
jgi:uncharacterized protein (TIGR02246 family)